MGKLFSKKKSPSYSTSAGFDSIDGAGQSRPDKTMSYHGNNMQQASVNGHTPLHLDAVVSLAKIQPGLCISGSKDKTIVLYDYNNHKIEDRWTGHEREITKARKKQGLNSKGLRKTAYHIVVRQVCYGSYCRGIFSASRDKSVKLWHRGNSHAVREFNGHELVVSAIHVNKDNSWLCSGSRDNTLKLWDVETGACLRENRTSRNLVTDVKFVADSHLLVQTGEDKEVRLFDTRTMAISHNFPRKQYIQMCCDVSPDGNYCLTCSNGFGGNGCEATLWDLRSLSIIQEYKGHTEAVESCIFLPHNDHQLIATSSRDSTVRVWDQNTKETLAMCAISCSGPLTSLIAYEDSTICVSSFNEGIHELSLSITNRTLRQKSRF